MDLTKLIDKCKQYNKVYLYGAGIYGKKTKRFLEQNGVEVEAFLQTSIHAPNCQFRGTPIYGIYETIITDDDLILVSVAENKQDEIISILKSKCVTNEECITKSIYDQISEEVDYSNVADVTNEKYIQVLFFHRVIEKKDDPWGLEVRPEMFDQYIRYIAENYNVKRFEEDWSDVKEKTLVITFDDGYWDNVEYALPILEKYKVPATVFVSTGNLDTPNEFWWDRLARLVPSDKLVEKRNELRKLSPRERDKALEEMEQEGNAFRERLVTDRTLTNDELKRLSDSEFITIGGHTVNHNALLYQTEEQQRYELMHSKKIIEDIIGKKITTFSYPFGQRDTYSDTTIRLLNECGFTRAASTVQELTGRDFNPYEIPRIGQPEVDLKTFARKLEEKWYMEG
ncbi:polysaccharide deacetylase family protein [Butyrivibrio sp. CB08]|uniref:polysaccharide deacetylase family protein n=1 Tax=Butyrivibrio sp. CB08 TaxID=2364879 RepID=UPI000EAA81E1|nr:polysaccharide deacetylase family protein [Butyrivibrio sp. CB08]RKM60413.1 polysaccharide deacetylase family protein [Butyrivibrio sp. CB08]